MTIDTILRSVILTLDRIPVCGEDRDKMTGAINLLKQVIEAVENVRKEGNEVDTDNQQKQNV